MAFLGGILGENKREFSEDEFIEIEPEAASKAQEIPVRIAHLNEYSDADKIQKAVRGGHIVFVKIKQLKEKDMSELKRAIERLRKTVTAIDGKIVGIDENYVLVSPSYARITEHKKEK